MRVLSSSSLLLTASSCSLSVLSQFRRSAAGPHSCSNTTTPKEESTKSTPNIMKASVRVMHLVGLLAASTSNAFTPALFVSSRVGAPRTTATASSSTSTRVWASTQEDKATTTTSKPKVQELGLLTFDLDDTLYPIDAVVKAANGKKRPFTPHHDLPFFLTRAATVLKHPQMPLWKPWRNMDFRDFLPLISSRQESKYEPKSPKKIPKRPRHCKFFIIYWSAQ